MGHRLNIEILENGEVLANSYYHCSGYTSSAIILVREILKGFKKAEQNEFEGVRKAIDLLELTGAGLSENEKDYLYFIGDQILLYDTRGYVGRNKGLISVSENGIAETRKFTDMSVEIDLEKQTIKFDALVTMTREEFFFNYKGKNLIDFDWDIDLKEVSFDDFDEVFMQIEGLIDSSVYYFGVKNDNIVYLFI